MARRLILDSSNFSSASSVEQPARVKKLFEAGCLMKILKPGVEGLSKMHAKCFILDGNVVLDGSASLSWFGFNSNYEHVHQIADPTVVSRMQRSFDALWERSVEVTPGMVQKQIDVRAAQVEAGKVRAQSKSEERKQARETKARVDDHAAAARMERGTGHSRRRSLSLPKPPHERSALGIGSMESSGATDENAETGTASVPQKSAGHAHHGHHRHHHRSGSSKQFRSSEV